MTTHLRPVYILLVLLAASCQMLPDAEDPVLVEDVPTITSLTDSLDSLDFNVVKWYVQDDSIGHAFQDDVDWAREFKAFSKDDVNHLRYKDAYDVSDTTIGGVRTVTFTATNKGQEVRSMRYEIENGRLIGFELKKERDNIFSSSKQHFLFNKNRYSLSIEQGIDVFFNNDQFLHGTILPKGELWRAVFDLGGDPMPLQCVIQPERLIVKNGLETLSFPKRESASDSLVYESEYFNAYFRLHPSSDGFMEGLWINDKYDKRRTIPVRLKKGIPYRFHTSSTTEHDLSGEHLLLFEGADGEFSDSTVLVLDQIGPMISGSILTETGDYRFLDGVVRNDSILMSTMDGTHAYLFKGEIVENQLKGVFCAGTTWKQPWIAELNSAYDLRSPESITKATSDTFDFSFPTINGEIVSLTDERFEDRVVLVTIMGTWCSNCLDETLFLKKVRERYDSDELQIVALDFELVNDSAVARRNIRRHIASLEVPYPVLLASLGTSKAKASALLPALNGVFSYPTLIVLDRNHEVVRIHTGFNGPATGKERYLRFEEEYFQLFDRLTAE